MQDWSNWPEAYYATTEREERRSLLEARLQSGEADEKNQIRKKMWELRYQKRDKMPEGVDYFIRSWMELFFISKKMGKMFHKKESHAKDLVQIKKDFGFELAKEYGAVGEEVLYEELCHGVGLYIKLCQIDRQYGSLLMGIMKMKPKDLAVKIANEIHKLTVEVPKYLEQEEEFALLTKAAKESFWKVYAEYNKEETILLEKI